MSRALCLFTEPFAIGFNASHSSGFLPRLKWRVLNDLSAAISDRFEVLVHSQAINGCLCAHVVSTLAL